MLLCAGERALYESIFLAMEQFSTTDKEPVS